MSQVWRRNHRTLLRTIFSSDSMLMVLPEERPDGAVDEPVPPLLPERRKSQNLMARGGRCGSPGGMVNPITGPGF